MNVRSAIKEAIKKAEKKPLPGTPWFSGWNFNQNPFERNPKDIKSAAHLIARHEELQQLTEQLVFFARGQRGIFLLWGPHGAGKTSVINVVYETVVNERNKLSKELRENLKGKILDCETLLEDTETEYLLNELTKTKVQQALEESWDENHSFWILDDCSSSFEQLDQIIAETRRIQSVLFTLNATTYNLLCKEKPELIANVQKIIQIPPLSDKDLKSILEQGFFNQISKYIEASAVDEVILNSKGIPSLMLLVFEKIGQYVVQHGRKKITLKDTRLFLNNEFRFVKSKVTKTEIQILEKFFLEKKRLTVKEIADYLEIDRTSASTHLSNLKEKGFLQRLVVNRKAFYKLVIGAAYIIDRLIFNRIERELK